MTWMLRHLESGGDSALGHLLDSAHVGPSLILHERPATDRDSLHQFIPTTHITGHALEWKGKEIRCKYIVETSKDISGVGRQAGHERDGKRMLRVLFGYRSVWANCFFQM
jgi:hypothetical protein